MGLIKIITILIGTDLGCIRLPRSALAAGAGGPFYAFLLVQFIRGIPRDLDEAAKMDGASWFGVYYHVILPLIKPALVTVAIYTFGIGMISWDT